jgi:SOS regulatory protein LexA
VKKEIIKTINSMSGSQSPYNIFCDWIELMALSIANSLCIIHSRTWHDREKRYIQIVEKYSKDDMHNFVNMFAWLTKNFEEKDIVDVPLLGKVTAGSPIEAIEMPDEFFSLPASMIPTRKEVFTLRVSGTSMINAGIHDGDIVIVQKQSTANNGEIVVAMTEENEVTLKTFYKEDGYFRLQPENDTMAPIILDKVYIVGKAIGLYRKI